MLPNTSRICIEMLPFGYAARATRTVSCGTGLIACALRDIGALLKAFLLLLCLPFLASPFLYRRELWVSPAVSNSRKNHFSVSPKLFPFPAKLFLDVP